MGYRNMFLAAAPYFQSRFQDDDWSLQNKQITVSNPCSHPHDTIAAHPFPYSPVKILIPPPDNMVRYKQYASSKGIVKEDKKRNRRVRGRLDWKTKKIKAQLGERS